MEVKLLAVLGFLISEGDFPVTFLREKTKFVDSPWAAEEMVRRRVINEHLTVIR